MSAKIMVSVLSVSAFGSSARRAQTEKSALAHSTDRSEAIVGNSMLNPIRTDVFNQMKQYRSTPWYKEERKEINSTTWQGYEWGMLDYRQFPHEVPVAREPITSIDGSQARISYMNAHAGDLLEHSKWTALQLALWKRDAHFWVQGVDVGLAIVIGLLHDIIKGADCSFTCVRSHSGEGYLHGALDTFPIADLGPVKQRMHCYYDTYSQLKYKGQHDGWHAFYVSAFLQTAIPSQYKNGLSLNNQFWRKCPTVNELRKMWRTATLQNEGSVRLSSEYGGVLGGDVAAVLLALNEWKEQHKDYALPATELMQEFVGTDTWTIYQVVLATRLHWQVGRLNFGKGQTRPTTKLSAKGYLNIFAAQIQEYAECGSGCAGLDDASCHRGPHCLSVDGKVPIFNACDDKAKTRKLLQLCLAVSAADIAGGSPSRDRATGSRKGEREQFSDTGTGKEANIVTDKTNAAKTICKLVEENDTSLESHFTAQERETLKLACGAGCGATDRYSCHLDQRYPALDVWSAPLPTSFSLNQRVYYDSVLNLFDTVAASNDAYQEWCEKKKSDLQDAEKLYHMGLGSGDSREKVVFGLHRLGMTELEKDSCISYCHDDTGDDGMGFFKLGTATGELDVQIACSVPRPLTLPQGARKSALIPEDAESFSFLYTHPSAPDLGAFGGFVYFGRKTHVQKKFPVVGINILSPKVRASTQFKLSFSKSTDVPADAHNTLRAIIKSEGIIINPKSKGFGWNGYVNDRMPGVYRYAWYPPGLGRGLGDHGGFVFSTNPADHAAEIAAGPGEVQY